ncbi:hypothetical protein Tco_1426180 [Tanacetum coccineum]
MSSNNASSAVTYTSVSFHSNGPSSWGIPLVNAGELPEMDSYEESEHLEYHAPSDDDIQVEDQPYANDASPADESPGYIAESDSMEDTDEDSIDYLDEPEDGEEDDDKDPKEDPSEEHEPEDDDDDDIDDEDEEPTEDKEEEEHLASADSSVAPLGHRVAMIRMRDDIPEEDMPPQRRFVLTAPPPGCDVAESSAAAARAPRAADRAEDVGYVRALQTSKHMMMTSIEKVNLRTDRRDIRLEIDVVRGQRTAYETELHEVRQAYLSSEARNRALLARLETLETHMSRMEWQRQRAEDDAVRQMMRIHMLEARARIDMVEDTSSSC